MNFDVIIKKKKRDYQPIHHLGKTYQPYKNYGLISNEMYEYIVANWYKNYSEDEVARQMYCFYNGGTKIDKVIENYFKRLMNDCRKGPRWTINEVLLSKELISYAVYYSSSQFLRKENVVGRLKLYFRLWGTSLALLLPNYPPKSATAIIKKYNVNNHYFDYSAGWGVRMLSSLKNNCNYYAVDVNPELVTQLNKCGQLFRTVNWKHLKNVACDVRLQGSETFIPEYKNKMGLCFTSPPYYDLEEYKKGEQSINNRTYQQWLDEYMRPTIINCKEYLIPGGYFLMNIKNIKRKERTFDDMNNLILKGLVKIPIYDDAMKICYELGLEFVREEILVNQDRYIRNGMTADNNEKIMVFKKI